MPKKSSTWAIHCARTPMLASGMAGTKSARLPGGSPGHIKAKANPAARDASARQTVNRNRIRARHQAAFDVVLHTCRRALLRVADPGAAGRQHHQTIVRRHGLKPLAAQLQSR